MIDNNVVQEHSLWNSFQSSLCKLAEEDYPRKGYFAEPPRVAALDLDKYERQCAAQITDCTCDAVIGVREIKKDGSVARCAKLLLVELRMGVANWKQVDFNKLRKKVEHSKNVIGADIPLFPKYYFIYSKTIAEQVKYKIFNELKEHREKGKGYIVASYDDFRSNLYDADVLPL